MATTAPTVGTFYGRYQILKPLAKGGMAEVLLARTMGVGGFERHVVIKRIRLDNHADDKHVAMFMDEARLVASLHHRNIVQVHDVGEEEGQYFFAMEYVHGEDARTLLRHLKDKGAQIPLEHLITIVTGAAAGLHYAHEARGPDRKPLNVVHRDISPGNILLGFDGGVKVVDFGIAKAEVRTQETQAGEMKGKVGYMSPEQCRAQPIDRRTDVYLLGIVLYELCTVRRLFKADSRYETMSMIVDGNIPPPGRYRKDLPPELEVVIYKALATEVEDRYQTADELRVALQEVALKLNLTPSVDALSDYLKAQFGERPEPWQVDARPPEFDPERMTPMPRASRPTMPPPAAFLTDVPATSPASADSSEPAKTETPMSWPIDTRATNRKTMILGGVGGVVVLLVIFASFALTSKSRHQTTAPPPPASGTQPIGTVDPADAAAAPVDAAEAVAVTVDAAPTVAPDAAPAIADRPGGRPVGGRPLGARPNGAKPDGAKPNGGKPDGAKPDGAKPDAATPVVPKPDEDLDSPLPNH